MLPSDYVISALIWASGATIDHFIPCVYHSGLQQTLQKPLSIPTTGRLMCQNFFPPSTTYSVMLTNKSREHSSVRNCKRGKAKRNVVGVARFNCGDTQIFPTKDSQHHTRRFRSFTFELCRSRPLAPPSWWHHAGYERRLTIVKSEFVIAQSDIVTISAKNVHPSHLCHIPLLFRAGSDWLCYVLPKVSPVIRL